MVRGVALLALVGCGGSPGPLPSRVDGCTCFEAGLREDVLAIAWTCEPADFSRPVWHPEIRVDDDDPIASWRLDLSTLVGPHVVSATVLSDLCVVDLGEVVVDPYPDNLPPVASAGPSRSVDACELPAVAELDGTDSFDPEGHALAYRWSMRAGDAQGLGAADLAATSYTAAELGIVVVELEVRDDVGETDVDTVTLDFVCLD